MWGDSLWKDLKGNLQFWCGGTQAEIEILEERISNVHEEIREAI